MAEIENLSDFEAGGDINEPIDLSKDNETEETSSKKTEELDEMAVLKARLAEFEEESRKLDALKLKGVNVSNPTAPVVATGPEADKCSVYVGQVDYSVKEEELQELFSTCGQLVRVTIMRDKWTQHPKGYAYVQFKTTEGVENAVLLDGSELKGRNIKVTPKRTNVPGLSRGRGGYRGRSSYRGYRGGYRGYRGRGYRGGYRGYRGRGYRGRGYRSRGRPMFKNKTATYAPYSAADD